ncbi:MAG: sodium:solute symporter [Pirellulales bacterium]
MTLPLGPVDLAVLIIYFAAMLLVGVWAGARSTNLEAYVLGDRNLPWWAILGSIVATETSTATVLSVPGEAFGPSGFRFLQLALGYVVGRILIVRLLLPLYFQSRLFTAYEVLERRFGGMTQRAASLLFLVTRNLGDGLRLFLAAIVLQKLTGLPFAISVAGMGAVTIIYTVFGGLRSVVWNDCLQLAIYLVGGLVAVFVIVARLPGGWSELQAFAAEHHKWTVFDFRLTLAEPYTFWAGLFGGAILTLGTHGTDHMMVQRYLSARSQRDAGRAVVASGLVVAAQFALFLLIGVELACYYARHPEIHFARTDEVFADFMVREFPVNTGLVGLLLAAILAAAMSTLSSSLNASASALVHDFLLTPGRPLGDPARALLRTRLLTVVFGIVQMGIGLAATYLDASVVRGALTIAGYSAGLLLGVFALGVFTRTVDARGAVAGGVTGLMGLLFIQFGLPAWGIKVAFPWYALIGATLTFSGGLLFSGGTARQEAPS